MSDTYNLLKLPEPDFVRIQIQSNNNSHLTLPIDPNPIEPQMGVFFF